MNDANRHHEDFTQNSPSPIEPTPKLAEPIRTITADELLRGQRELIITHGDAVYRLLVTRNGKLILQK
ncbi:MAG: hemin uptake protein HemP [Planctomycetales bacterium]|nr:hemin uptake protein HemP [Planctomycetales bacterium]